MELLCLGVIALFVVVYCVVQLIQMAVQGDAMFWIIVIGCLCSGVFFWLGILLIIWKITRK